MKDVFFSAVKKIISNTHKIRNSMIEVDFTICIYDPDIVEMATHMPVLQKVRGRLEDIRLGLD